MENKILYTDIAKDLDKSSPHSYYPRPQFKRDSFFCLNGEWNFEILKSNTVSNPSGTIIVPFCPESALSGICTTVNKGDFLHYSRLFTLPEKFKKDRTVIHFGAVDQICRVYLNGTLLGKHEGGYTPFSFDITDYIKEKDNCIYVIAEDNLDKKYPYGKQTDKRGGMWYTPVSGIWQTVWIESLPENNIEKIQITQSAEEVYIKVFGGKGKKIFCCEGEDVQFDGDSIRFCPKSKELWTPENPRLYYFTLSTETDKIESYFALREIGVEEFGGIKRLTLNGKPYLFNGLLDQ